MMIYIAHDLLELVNYAFHFLFSFYVLFFFLIFEFISIRLDSIQYLYLYMHKTLIYLWDYNIYKYCNNPPLFVYINASIFYKAKSFYFSNICEGN